MTRETRIGLLIGLGFVVVFGLVLSELTDSEAPVPVSDEIATAYRHTYVIDETPDASGERTVRISRRQAAVQGRGGSGAVPAAARRSGGAAVHAAQVRSAPAQGATRYAVRQGDTLIGIARRVYGPGRERQYRRIFQANRRILSDEGAVRPGQVLVIPPLTYSSPEPAPTGARADERVVQADTDHRRLPQPIAAAITHRPQERVYVVKRGDTLQEVAYIFYRDDSRRSVMKIYDANEQKLQDLDHLLPGMALTIPR